MFYGSYIFERLFIYLLSTINGSPIIPGLAKADQPPKKKKPRKHTCFMVLIRFKDFCFYYPRTCSSRLSTYLAEEKGIKEIKQSRNILWYSYAWRTLVLGNDRWQLYCPKACYSRPFACLAGLQIYFKETRTRNVFWKPYAQRALFLGNIDGNPIILGLITADQTPI